MPFMPISSLCVGMSDPSLECLVDMNLKGWIFLVILDLLLE